MTKQKHTFTITHRILQKAIKGNFGYSIVEIDISNGLFKQSEIDSKHTLIRANGGVFGEVITYGTPTALSLSQIKKLETQFNAVRTKEDWYPVEFRKTKKVEDEMPNTSKVQR